MQLKARNSDLRAGNNPSMAGNFDDFWDKMICLMKLLFGLHSTMILF